MVAIGGRMDIFVVHDDLVHMDMPPVILSLMNASYSCLSSSWPLSLSLLLPVPTPSQIKKLKLTPSPTSKAYNELITLMTVGSTSQIQQLLPCVTSSTPPVTLVLLSYQIIQNLYLKYQSQLGWLPMDEIKHTFGHTTQFYKWAHITLSHITHASPCSTCNVLRCCEPCCRWCGVFLIQLLLKRVHTW